MSLAELLQVLTLYLNYIFTDVKDFIFINNYGPINILAWVFGLLIISILIKIVKSLSNTRV